MADEQQSTEQQSTEQQSTEGGGEQKPAETPAKPAPWGADFDAERAWTLVENLRKERDAAKGSLKEHEDAKKTESEKIADRLAAAEKAANDARRELLVERLQRKHNLPEDAVEFLFGDTEEEIEAKASRLAALSGAKKTEGEGETEEQGEKPAIPGKPKPALTPGHGGDSASSEEFDPDKVAKAARRGY